MPTMRPAAQPETAGDNCELIISRLINAPRERVFQAWTAPQKLVQWWGQNGFTLALDQAQYNQGRHHD